MKSLKEEDETIELSGKHGYIKVIGNVDNVILGLGSFKDKFESEPFGTITTGQYFQEVLVEEEQKIEVVARVKG